VGARHNSVSAGTLFSRSRAWANSISRRARVPCKDPSNVRWSSRACLGTVASNFYKRTSPTSDRRRKEKRTTQNMNRNIARERKQIPFLARKTPNKSEASKAI